MKARTQQLIPLLFDIENALEQDLSLSSLASRFGASAYHFHRIFSESIGETPRKHIERMRIERAALLLAVSDTPVTEIAFSLGFRNLETFSRRYKAALGYTPSDYRRMAKAAQAKRVSQHNFHDNAAFFLSRARFETLPDMHLLAIRHLGDYGALNESFAGDSHIWKDVVDEARARGLAFDPVFIGLFHDDPTMTPMDLQRCDACIPLRATTHGCTRARYLEFQGGPYAIAQYVGRVDHLLQAFQGLADEIRRSQRYTFRTGAAVEFLRRPNVGGETGVHQLDVCFPVAIRRV